MSLFKLSFWVGWGRESCFLHPRQMIHRHMLTKVISPPIIWSTSPKFIYNSIVLALTLLNWLVLWSIWKSSQLERLVLKFRTEQVQSRLVWFGLDYDQTRQNNHYILYQNLAIFFYFKVKNNNIAYVLNREIRVIIYTNPLEWIFHH